MNKARILHLIEDMEIGGLERTVENIYRGLNKKKYTVHLWCLAGGGELAEMLIKEKENVRILNLKSYHNPLNIIRLVLLIRMKRFEIIHTHGYFSGTFGRIAAFIARVPIIISHVHTTNWDLKKRHRIIERLLSIITDRILCCSDYVKYFLNGHEKIHSKKIIRIYNGVKEMQSHINMNEHTGHQKQKIKIVTIASLVKNKGHRYLIKAIKSLVEDCPNIELILVGEGPLSTELKCYAQSLEIREKVKFLGRLSDVEPILQESDIVVLPSIEREGLGVCLIEAMRHSRPVIGSKIGGIPELIDDGVNGYLVPPRDSDALARKIERLISSEQERKRLGGQGRKKYEKKFRVEKMIDDLEKVYDLLLSKNARLAECYRT
jgi:glycosyltransferase involved in cell wall biosynthesis